MDVRERTRLAVIEAIQKADSMGEGKWLDQLVNNLVEIFEDEYFWKNKGRYER